jgi:hypothetical protein
MKSKYAVSKELRMNISEFRDLLNVLIDDLKSINKKGISQFWRRTLLRTMFANIESFTYAIKHIAFQISIVKSKKLSISEKLFIDEEEYKLEDNGEITHGKRAKIRTKSNFLFSFKVLAKVCGTVSPIKTDKSNDWNNFINVLKLRNRITHPKNKFQLTITDEEYEKIREVLRWYIKLLGDSSNLIFEQLNSYEADVKKAT